MQQWVINASEFYLHYTDKVVVTYPSLLRQQAVEPGCRSRRLTPEAQSLTVKVYHPAIETIYAIGLCARNFPYTASFIPITALQGRLFFSLSKPLKYSYYLLMRIDANDVHEGIGVKQRCCPILFLSFAYQFSLSVRRLDKHLTNILPSKGFEKFK